MEKKIIIKKKRIYLANHTMISKKVMNVNTQGTLSQVILNYEKK